MIIDKQVQAMRPPYASKPSQIDLYFCMYFVVVVVEGTHFIVHTFCFPKAVLLTQ